MADLFKNPDVIRNAVPDVSGGVNIDPIVGQVRDTIKQEEEKAAGLFPHKTVEDTRHWTKKASDMLQVTNPLHAVSQIVNPFGPQTLEQKVINDPDTLWDFGSEAALSATMGGSSFLNAALESVVSGKTFQEEQLEAAQQREARRENLGGAGTLEAQTLGTLTPFGGPAKLAMWADRALEGGKGVFGLGRRMLGQGAVAAGEEAVTDLATGDTSLLSAVLSPSGGELAQEAAELGFDTLLGAAGQGILGEALPTAVKYATGNMPKARLGGTIADQGAETTPLSPDRIMDEVVPALRADPEATVSTILDEADAGEITRRVADYVPEVEYPRGRTGDVMGSTEARIRTTEQALDAMDDQLDQVDGYIKQDMATVLDQQVSRADQHLATQQKLDPNRQVYGTIFGQSGKKKNTIPYEGEAVPFLAAEFKKAFGGAPHEVGGLPGDMWKAMENSLRPEYMTEAGSVRQIPEWSSFGERNELGNITYDRLLSTRKKLARMTKPGAMINGTVIDRETANASTSLVKALDDLITSKTGAQYGDARNNFSRIMREDDAYNYGADIVESMGKWANEGGETFLEAWPKMTPAEKENLRAGFAMKLAQRLEGGQPFEVLKDLYGDIQRRPGRSDVGVTKEMNDRIMKEIFGEEVNNNLKRVLTKWKPVQDEIRTAQARIAVKAENPSATAGEVTGNTEQYGVRAVTPGAGGITLTSVTGSSALGALIGQAGPKDAALINELLTAKGDEAADLLEDIIRSYQMKEQVGTGAMLGAYSGGAEEEDIQSRDDYNLIEDEKKSILDFLGR